MKVKQLPEDFQVEELTHVTPAGQGRFAFYRLEKRGWSTPDAIQAVRRRWQVDWQRISYGGLKDRHALTGQYFTILHGPRRGLTHHGVRVQYLGHVETPYSSHDIEANRFRIVVRHLTAEQVVATRLALDEVRVDGIPNYFDDQRFGSVAGNDFVARHLVRGEFEAGLRLALTAPYEFDKAEQKREKATLCECWGNWPECKARLPRGHARSLVDYLVSHPTDFRGAVERLRPELQGLYLSAYQSHLWNGMLAARLESNLPPEQRLAVRLRLGDVPMHRQLTVEQRERLRTLTLPLPSARLPLDPAAEWAPLVEGVLAAEGLRLSDMRIKGVRKPFFSKGERAALCEPAGLRDEADDDELHASRSKLTLSFDLPRGSYATLIVKRVTTPGSPSPDGGAALPQQGE
jgi:tRNA pseudouridine13 synthase